MSKSLEIINKKIKYSYSQGILLTNIELEELQTIKQDLELLEQLKQQRDRLAIDNGELVVKVCNLEKENQELLVNKNVAQAVALNQKREIDELKDKIAYLQEDGEEWQSAYELSQSKNAILKLENQELKKVIDILVDFLDLDVDVENSNLNTILGTISFYSEDNSLIDDLKLLKEVLEDE